MQTYILSTNIVLSASWLDNKRLGKQIVEGMQIYRANFENGPKPGNPHAYTMWLNYSDYLIEYGCIHYLEWRDRFKCGKRGGKLLHKSGEEFLELGQFNANMYWSEDILEDILNAPPPWLTEEFASNHRAILLGKVYENVVNIPLQHFSDRVYSQDELKEIKRISNKRKRVLEIYNWYNSLGWSEQPAKRILIDGKLRWPYLWPEIA